MADITATTTSTTPVPTAPLPQQQAPKSPLFGGNAAVFENLDKFEQISNPVGEPTFDFEFEDAIGEEQQEEKSDFSVGFASDTPTNESASYELLPEAEDTQSEMPTTPEFEDDFVELPVAEVAFEGEKKSIFDEHLGEEGVPSEVNNQEAPYMPDVEEFSTPMGEPEQTFETLPVENPIQHSQEPDSSELEELPVYQAEFPVQQEGEVDQEMPSTVEYSAPENPIEDMTQHSQDTLEMGETISSQNLGEEHQSGNAELVAHQQLEQEPRPKLSKLMDKYQKLLGLAEEILHFQHKLNQEGQFFELSGGTTSKSQISYFVSVDKNAELPMLHIKRLETMVDTQEQNEHILSLTSEKPDSNLKILIDNELLYTELQDLQEGNRVVFVSEKLNKFDFFFTDKHKELAQKREVIQQEREKQSGLRAIFRSF